MCAQTARQSVTIKKYANRRLYNTATSSYVTLEDLSLMVKEGCEFNVYDAKSSEDITRSVLTQIIVEEENKTDQENLLPINFLRQLISFYGDSLQWMVPKYLEHSMDALSGNQEQIRDYFQTTLGSIFPFGTTLDEMSKQNMSMFENTLRMFAPLTSLDTVMNALTPMATTTAATTKTTPSSTTSKTGATTACSTEKTSCSTQDNKASSCCSSTKAGETKGCDMPMSKTASSSTTTTGSTTTTAPMASVTNIKPRMTTETTGPVAATTTTTPTAPMTTTATPATATTTPMPNVQTAMASTNTGADDMQQKIANLQRQLADLAKSRA